MSRTRWLLVASGLTATACIVEPAPGEGTRAEAPDAGQVEDATASRRRMDRGWKPVVRGARDAGVEDAVSPRPPAAPDCRAVGALSKDAALDTPDLGSLDASSLQDAEPPRPDSDMERADAAPPPGPVDAGPPPGPNECPEDADAASATDAAQPAPDAAADARGAEPDAAAAAEQQPALERPLPPLPPGGRCEYRSPGVLPDLTLPRCEVSPMPGPIPVPNPAYDPADPSILSIERHLGGSVARVLWDLHPPAGEADEELELDTEGRLVRQVRWRVERHQWPAVTATRYQYDASGRVTRREEDEYPVGMEDQRHRTAVVTHAYDEAGRLILHQSSWLGNPDDEITRGPEGGRVWERAYDQEGRLAWSENLSWQRVEHEASSVYAGCRYQEGLLTGVYSADTDEVGEQWHHTQRAAEVRHDAEGRVICRAWGERSECCRALVESQSELVGVDYDEQGRLVRASRYDSWFGYSCASPHLQVLAEETYWYAEDQTLYATDVDFPAVPPYAGYEPPDGVVDLRICHVEGCDPACDRAPRE